MNWSTVLPLALVMIAGPQIISAIFLAASENPRRSSLAYLVGAGLAVYLGLTVWYAVFHAVRDTGSSQSKDRNHDLINWIVLALLVVLAAIVFARRKRNQPPKWMGKLETASPRFALGLGFLLFIAMPSDEATMAAVAGTLAGHDKPYWHVLPFLGLTMLLLSLPLLALLAFGQRVVEILPKIRDWANQHSWIVSEIVILIFVGIVASDLA